MECWGTKSYGQSSPPDGSFLEISAGSRHTCGLTIDGAVECWGVGTGDSCSWPYYNNCGQSITDFDEDGIRNYSTVHGANNKSTNKPVSLSSSMTDDQIKKLVNISEKKLCEEFKYEI